MPQAVMVSLAIEPLMYRNVEKRAQTLGLKPSQYLRQLLDAAYAARIGHEKKQTPIDPRLDEMVRACFALAGDRDAATIARATGFPPETVARVLDGFRIVASEIAGAPAPAPAPDAVDARDAAKTARRRKLGMA